MGNKNIVKTQTNFIEILLRETMIGKTIYDNDGNAILIAELNYQPLIRQVYIENDAGDSYKMCIDEIFDFDYTQISKIVPNKHKIIGKYIK